MIRLTALALAATLASTAPVCAQDGARASLQIDFDTGVSTGSVMVALYDSKAAYDGGQAIAQARVDVLSGQAAAEFEGLAPGDYAFKAFHDVNGDGRMNTNPFGMPTEPYAFSNNAVGNMGPASWDRARFAVDGDVAQTIEIK